LWRFANTTWTVLVCGLNVAHAKLLLEASCSGADTYLEHYKKLDATCEEWLVCERGACAGVWSAYRDGLPQGPVPLQCFRPWIVQHRTDAEPIEAV